MLRYFKDCNENLTHIQVCMHCDDIVHQRFNEEDMKTTDYTRIYSNPNKFIHLQDKINIVVGIIDKKDETRILNILKFFIEDFRPTYILFLKHTHHIKQMITSTYEYKEEKAYAKSCLYMRLSN